MEITPRSPLYAAPIATVLQRAKDPAAEVPAAAQAPQRGLLELVLRSDRRLDALLRDEASLPETLTKLIGIAVAALVIHGMLVGTIGCFIIDRSLVVSASDWLRGRPILWMPLIFPGAFLGALGVCLPSFYFYTQLAGLDASFRLVTAQAVRAIAVTAVLLLGLEPFYAAVALAPIVGIDIDSMTVLLVGLALPFVAGLHSLRTLRRAFSELLDVVPLTHARRGNFLGRLVLCWAFLYSLVAPAAFYRLGDLLGSRL